MIAKLKSLLSPQADRNRSPSPLTPKSSTPQHSDACVEIPEASSSKGSLPNPERFEALYTTTKRLGQGSFASVYLAVRKSDQQEFAVKIIDKASISEFELRSEISILIKIQHPNLIGLEDYFETPLKVYLVMQLATGGELFDLIEQRGFFSEKDAASIIFQILSGIEYLHALGIAHRDLKPENILLKDQNPNSLVAITDFGLSKMAGNDHFLHTVCGSPVYVSPEVLKKTPGHGRPVDMWAVGVITYVLLVGYTPFWGESQADLFEAIKTGDYQFEPEYWDSISANAKDFISKLLVLNPDGRLTASEALKHEWLATTVDSDILPTIKKNFKKNKFKSAAQAILLAQKMAHIERSNSQNKVVN
ncbi:hypothetical protein HDU84_006401 [Entophlyctis sp. JEL0112]|nr:hypothetical protein HDU84_006401 [Entophlyctis sp. JEL0112]